MSPGGQNITKSAVSFLILINNGLYYHKVHLNSLFQNPLKPPHGVLSDSRHHWSANTLPQLGSHSVSTQAFRPLEAVCLL